MSDPFGIEDNETSDVLFVFEDIAGNVTTAPTIDAGSITATSSDTTSLNVTVNSDNSGVTATAAGALDAAVVVRVEFTVAGVPWGGSETFNVGASAPTQLTLSPQTPNPTTPITPPPTPASVANTIRASEAQVSAARHANDPAANNAPVPNSPVLNTTEAAPATTTEVTNA